jgi:hypothetical protein
MIFASVSSLVAGDVVEGPPVATSSRAALGAGAGAAAGETDLDSEFGLPKLEKRLGRDGSGATRVAVDAAARGGSFVYRDGGGDAGRGAEMG